MMTTVAGIISAVAAAILILWWWVGRPMRGCVCGRCRKSITPLPRCRLSGPGATAWLEFLNGPMGGRSIELRAPQVSIGSVATNDVVLSDPAVSESHAVIECPGDRFVVKDQRSTNGVYVNEIRVKSLVLAGDDRLRIGNIDATVRLG